MTRFQFMAITCIAVQLCALCPAASIPPSPARRVGLLRLNETSGGASYHLLEQRLRRWLENDPSLALEVTPIDSSVSQQTLELQADLTRLQTVNARLSALVAESGDRANEEIGKQRPELDRLIVSARRQREGGPILKAALLTAALLDWRAGNDAGARESLLVASALDPAGRLPEALPWEWESSADIGAFLELVRKADMERARSCQVQLDVKPASAALSINGFPIGTRRQIDLIPGESYELRASAAGFDSAVQTVSCPSSGRQAARLALSAFSGKGRPDSAELRRLSEAHGLRSLVLVESTQDRYRLFLYTPGMAIDELPLQHPLTAKEVSESDSLPIAWDRFNELMDKHQLAPAKLALGPSASAVSGDQPGWVGRLTEKESGGGQWYTSTTFWAIAGTLAAGALVAFIATRGHSPETQPGVSYTIK